MRTLRRAVACSGQVAEFALQIEVMEKLTITVPGDKSISHRAVILSAISDGAVRVNGFLPLNDTQNTAAIIRQLGAKIEEENEDGTAFTVIGGGLRGLEAPSRDLDVGNSGTGIRLLSGLLSGQRFDSTITGDEQILRRPMERIVEPLRKMGARIEGENQSKNAPLRITACEGALDGIEYDMPVKSAQVKSAILLAGLYADGPVTVNEQVRTRDHTERMLRHFGVDVQTNGLTVCLKPGQSLKAEEVMVPGDFSAAVFSIVTAILHPTCELTVMKVGLNPRRLGLYSILRRMGADIEYLEDKDAISNEPRGTIVAASSQLEGVEVTQKEVDQAIDELPLVALAASQARGETVVKGGEELKHKESNRIKSSVSLVRELGGTAEETKDGFVVKGKTAVNDATVHTYGDHRIAFAALSAGIFSGKNIDVDNEECMETSYGGSFLDNLAKLRELMRGK